MGALLSDVKISGLTLQWLLKYDELKWEMGVKRVGGGGWEAVESLLIEEKIESVSSADAADTFKPQQHHRKCIRGVMPVFIEEWVHLSE